MAVPRGAAALADEHQDVLDVIETGDVEASVLRMTAHLERAVRDLTRVPR
ncbi:FCD domain-containing protein [Streptomyces sp. 6N223]